jgi:hypothetical protein
METGVEWWGGGRDRGNHGARKWERGEVARSEIHALEGWSAYFVEILGVAPLFLLTVELKADKL